MVGAGWLTSTKEMNQDETTPWHVLGKGRNIRELLHYRQWGLLAIS